MPLFFFDLAGHVRSPDDEGTRFPDVVAARIEAVRFAGDYLRDNNQLAWDGSETRVIVRDESNAVVFTLAILAIDCGCTTRTSHHIEAMNS
jgi:hypothetical protein